MKDSSMNGKRKYAEFLASKIVVHPASGIDAQRSELSSKLFDFQGDITRWALRKGRAAVFADCGLGKSAMQVQWAKRLGVKTLILAPLAVAPQTVREGQKFDVEVVYSRSPSDAQITITNYDMLEHFNPELSPFAGIGSEGYEAVKAGRRFIGIELKESYFKQACANLEAASLMTRDLFEPAR